MCQILPVTAVRIAENRGRFFKRDTVLFEIADSLPDVPGKHLLYIHELRWLSHYFLERLSDALSGWRRCRQRRRGGGELGAQTAASACSRVCGASTAKRPAALGYAGTGPAQRATGARLGWAARRQDPLFFVSEIIL